MSTIPTCAVHSTVRDSVGGMPLADATVTARLSSYELFEGFVVPRDVVTTTDNNGYFVLDLFPNELGSASSFYDIKIIAPNGKTLRTIAVVPNQEEAELSEISEVPPYEGKPDGAIVLTAVIEARTATKEYRDQANSASETAVVSKDIAEQASESAQAYRNDAGDHAVAANNAKGIAENAAADAMAAATVAADKAAEAAATISETLKKIEAAADDGATRVGTPEGTVQDALDARVKASRLAEGDGAAEIGASLATAGMRAGYVSDVIYKAIYTSTLENVSQGVALLKAMAYCRANDAELVVDADVTLDIADGATTANAWGVYMQGCPRIRGAGGTITLTGGQFGLDVSGDVISVRDLKTVSQGWQSTDLLDPIINAAIYGAGASVANYENITHANSVSDLTGKYRSAQAVIDNGSTRVQVTNVQATNTVSAILLLDNGEVMVDGVLAINASTGVQITRAATVVANKITLTNTREQASNWPGKNKPVSPRGFNGLDALLCEECGDVTIDGVTSTWASERAGYIQAKKARVSGVLCVNSDCFKVVGWNRTNPLKIGVCNDVHLLITPEFEVGDLRSTISLITTYFSDVLKVGGGSGVRTETTALAARALVTFGGFPYTTKSIDIDSSCYGDGVQTIVYGALMSETAAQLAVIDPTQTFRIADRVTVGGGVYNYTGGNQNGALIAMRDTEASADAKAAVAITSARFSDVELNLTTNAVVNNRPNWIVDPRYIGSIYATNVSTDGVYRNAGPNTAAVQATLKFVNVGIVSASTMSAQLTALDSITFAGGSSLELVQQPGGGAAVARARMLMRGDGLLKSQTITIDIAGPGYWQLGAAANGVINYRSVGAYIGNVAGAALTDVVGAKNITMTASAGNFELRGDLTPVKYVAQLSTTLP